MTQSKKMDNKKAGNSLRMEKHMDVLQACVMLPTPSWPMSARFLRAELKAKKDTDSVKMKVFTQTAAVSREVGGLQHSRLTGSSSQTKSVKETVKGTNFMWLRTSTPDLD